jgi:hypothetical protein
MVLQGGQVVEARRTDVTFLVLVGGKVISPPSRSVSYAGFVENLSGTLAVSDACSPIPFERYLLRGRERGA